MKKPLTDKQKLRIARRTLKAIWAWATVPYSDGPWLDPKKVAELCAETLERTKE